MDCISLTDVDVACHTYGNAAGDRTPLILLHGFPDDASAWSAVGERLAAAGRYAVAPFVRGCGPTRFKSERTPRSGQVTARLRDLIELMDALALERAVLVGQDWGAATAQAACMLHPSRVEQLVVLNGHGLLNAAMFAIGKRPSWDTLHAGWYQWLFQTPLGEPLLQADRRGFARHAWRAWSPGWQFDEAVLLDVCRSFDNPDWIDVVLSAYRGDGDPAADPRDAGAARLLAEPPAIRRPTLNLQGAHDGVDLFADTQLGQEAFYRGPFMRRVLDDCGHFVHRERPDAVADAMLEFLSATPLHDSIANRGKEKA